MRKQLIAALLTLFILPGSAFAASPLEKEIRRDLSSFDGRVGIYAKNLKTGKSYAFRDGDIFPTASTSKLIVTLAAYKYLYPQTSADQKEEYDKDVNAMMTVSDNTAFAAFLEEFDTRNRSELARTVKDLGLRKTRIHSKDAFNRYGYHSVTTPYEMARVLETIYRDKYLPRKQTQKIKNDLRNSIFQDEIPRHMLVPVVHKVGELDDTLCDVGVVEDGHAPILISVYTVTGNPDYASDFIASISAKLYNVLR